LSLFHGVLPTNPRWLNGKVLLTAGGAGTAGAFVFPFASGLWLAAWDGTGIDVADAPENARELGVPRAATRRSGCGQPVQARHRPAHRLGQVRLHWDIPSLRGIGGKKLANSLDRWLAGEMRPTAPSGLNAFIGPMRRTVRRYRSSS